jgi:hypothetical protein
MTHFWYKLRKFGFKILMEPCEINFFINFLQTKIDIVCSIGLKIANAL